VGWLVWLAARKRRVWVEQSWSYDRRGTLVVGGLRPLRNPDRAP